MFFSNQIKVDHILFISCPDSLISTSSCGLLKLAGYWCFSLRMDWKLRIYEFMMPKYVELGDSPHIATELKEFFDKLWIIVIV
jgi:hypothetical protein